MTRLSKQVDYSFEEAINRVTGELKKEGFGVLTTIDVKETLKKKIDVDFRKYIILGACNPALAHKALSAYPEIGLLMPCNVIIYEEESKTCVSIFDPMSMGNFNSQLDLGDLAVEGKAKLERVLNNL